MPEVIVRVRHLRQAKICTDGGRKFFAARGWPWTSFLDHGRPAEDFIATGDPFALRVAELAREESERGRS